MKNILGWFDYGEIYDMAVAKAADGAIFVEVGAWFGKSTAYMAQTIKNSKKNINFYVVDTWEGSIESKSQKEIASKHNNNLFPKFWENMTKANLDNYIKPLQIESARAANVFDNESIDFVFIDASHLYEAVILDLKSWFPKVKLGGIISGHDYHPRFGVIDAVNDFFPRYEVFVPKENKLTNSWIHYKYSTQRTSEKHMPLELLSVPSGGPV